MHNLPERFQGTTSVQVLELHMLYMNVRFNPKADLTTGVWRESQLPTYIYSKILLPKFEWIIKIHSAIRKVLFSENNLTWHISVNVLYHLPIHMPLI